ncbi:hypothetical protein ABW19_dt0203124 [Dactylella cylindrospora]|nr:hypothetical protein ABW19_dt0203124 [Dactylella cylindrospora]
MEENHPSDQMEDMQNTYELVSGLRAGSGASTSTSTSTEESEPDTSTSSSNSDSDSGGGPGEEGEESEEETGTSTSGETASHSPDEALTINILRDIRGYAIPGVTIHVRQTNKLGGIANTDTSNLCYINSGLQALAATSYATTVFDPIHELGEFLEDFPAPVTDELRFIFADINYWYTNNAEEGRVVTTPHPSNLELPPSFLPPGDAAASYSDCPQSDIREFLETLIDHVQMERTTRASVLISMGMVPEDFALAPLPVEGAQAELRSGHDSDSEGETYIGIQYSKLLDRITKIERILQGWSANTEILVTSADRDAIKMPALEADTTPQTTFSFSQAISSLPKVLILNYDIVSSVKVRHEDGTVEGELKENYMNLKIPPVISFAPYTADHDNQDVEWNSLKRIRPDGSTFKAGEEYQCRSIVYHQDYGSGGTFGHYIADRLPWVPIEGEKKQPYEWWGCNEGWTDMFIRDQPFPQPHRKKGAEVLVIYERIDDEAERVELAKVEKHLQDIDKEVGEGKPYGFTWDDHLWWSENPRDRIYDEGNSSSDSKT